MIEFKKNNFFLNEEVNTFLKNIIKNKSLANGYIFYGAEGLGKKETALQFIKEIFKQSSPSENVEERISNNNHPDFLIIEPDSLLAKKVQEVLIWEKQKKVDTRLSKLLKYVISELFLVKNQSTQKKKLF